MKSRDSKLSIETSRQVMSCLTKISTQKYLTLAWLTRMIKPILVPGLLGLCKSCLKLPFCFVQI
ncbi:probable LRR receptor-like serine/threonine-protein kinase at1g53420 [Phtheirospermum japonicum]|uniref:Probable LRR receptor-like serine/threonine-protein kinase at1g53420 n=1 Tax=Phtheirospermum japonicum TaxID=374723 RepID=A0A830BUG1_9LAMI|nr:probable LRR receptor-like serine/threonine-protein kinase at1g53420 [Phtheirospermum japonicum]